MKRLYILAALLIASTSAHAGNSLSLQVDGHRVRIELPDRCDQLSCVRISAPGLSGFDFRNFKSGHGDDGDNVVRADPPAPKATPAPAAAAPAPPAIVAAPPSATPAVPAGNAPVTRPTVTAEGTPSASTLVAALTPAPVTNQAAAPVAAAIPAAAPKQQEAAAAPATPLGIWATEDNKGVVRIEACGESLCGYGAKSGEKILINMKPSSAKWIGQIRDPDSGKNYDSTIAMKNANALRVQGCAFGGMFCQSQIWKRAG